MASPATTTNVLVTGSGVPRYCRLCARGASRERRRSPDMLIFVWTGDPDFPIRTEALDLRTGKWLLVSELGD